MSVADPLALPSATLEGEFAAVLRILGFSAPQAGAVAARLGWDGRGGATLGYAGRARGYTRERVRQLQRRAERLVEDRRAFDLPLLDRAVEIAEAAAPDTREHVASRLWSLGLCAAPFDPAGIVAAARLFGRSTSLAVNGDIVVAGPAGEPTPRLVEVARRVAECRGAAGVREVAFETGIDVERVRRLLATVPEVRWLDTGRWWLSLRVPDLYGRSERILRKLFSLAPQLSLDEIDDGLRRPIRPVALPEPILLDLLDSVAWLSVDRNCRVARADRPFTLADELASAEAAIVGIVAPLGRVVSFVEVARRGAAAGMQRSTVAHYLRYSPVFTTIGRGRYALRGAG